MPFETIPNGSITTPRGFLAGATFAGIKTYGPGKKDLALLVSTFPCTAAGLFTSNQVKAAPILLCQEHLAYGRVQAIIANSGCANACTGPRGLADARAMATLAATELHLDPRAVLVASTGKIGVPMPMDKVRAGLEDIVLTPDGGHDFAQAIMTTDTRPKEIAVWVAAETSSGDPRQGEGYVIAGCAKGAGMIHPNLATMLAFLTTDAAVDREFLQTALRRAAAVSFNMISVDGDMSTNDTLLILANGAARRNTPGVGNRPIADDPLPPLKDPESPEARLFQEALNFVCIHLAKSIAADGEEATRLITVHVRGAPSSEDARRAARAIVASNLTKCAIHGADPNWGRILCAVGYSGAQLDPDRLECLLGDVRVVENGTPVAFDVQAARQALSGKEVTITIDLHLGDFCATAWGCDMTEGYVRFNSEYTT